MLRLFAPVLFVALISAQAPASAQDPTEILLRLDRIEAENRRLTGDVEKMQFQIERLEQQLKKSQADNELRFQDLEGGAAAKPAAKPPVKKTEAEPVDPTLEQPLPEPATDEPSEPKAEPVPKANAEAGSAADYEAAVALLEGDSLADAEIAFRAFLKTYPKDKLVPEAMFGLGESLYGRERFADAAEHYLNLTNQYPKSRRAAEALLKLGMSLNGLGARVEACSTYAEVAKKYPKADSSVKQAVSRQRSLAKCS